MRPVNWMLVVAMALVAHSDGSFARAQAPPAPSAQAPAAAASQPVYLVYYWRARPGKLGEYGEYIRKVAQPIDEEARKAGVFEEVHTYTPALVTGAFGSDWTHMRVFRLKSLAAWETFGAGLDEATRRAVPDEAKRRENSERVSELRDLVRQEIWREMR